MTKAQIYQKLTPQKILFFVEKTKISQFLKTIRNFYAFFSLMSKHAEHIHLFSKFVDFRDDCDIN
jgi:hypothetical protein